jgi:hypothetical protein
LINRTDMIRESHAHRQDYTERTMRTSNIKQDQDDILVYRGPTGPTGLYSTLYRT